MSANHPGHAPASTSSASVSAGAAASGPATTQPLVEAFFALSNEDLLKRFAVGVENFPRRLFALNDQQLDTAFLPSAGVGQWPVRVLMGHLADAEIAFVHRLRRIYAEDKPVLSVWDENAFIDRGIYGDERTPPERRRSIGGFVATIHTMRRWSLEWLITLEPSDFERTGLHPVRGEQTLKRVLAYSTWHIEHHTWYLNRKIAKFAPSMPA